MGAPRAYSVCGEFHEIAAAYAEIRSLCTTALIERVLDVKFCVKPEDLPDDCISGRAFGPTVELRWRRDGLQWHGLLIADDPQCSISSLSDADSKLQIYGREEWLLLGEKRDGASEWGTGRIPDPIHYPGVSGDRVGLSVKLYCVDDDPIPSIARYCELIDLSDQA